MFCNSKIAIKLYSHLSFFKDCEETTEIKSHQTSEIKAIIGAQDGDDTKIKTKYAKTFLRSSHIKLMSDCLSMPLTHIQKRIDKSS